SSRNEGTPLTLIEAMANARPVIATAVGGVVDLLGQPLAETQKVVPSITSSNQQFQVCERGVSVPPDDPSAFAAGLAFLLTDAVLRRETGARGLQFVTAHYSKE